MPSSPGPAEQAAAVEDPWVCQTLVHWERARAGVRAAELELSLLSMALTPFYLGGAIRPEQALAFFARAEPGFSPRKLQEAIALLSVAHQDNPSLCRFLAQLAAQL